MKPRVADGLKIIESLSGSPAYAKIKAIYRQAWVAQSCVGDLRQAAQMADALQALLRSSRKKGTADRGATETALLAQAIQLYARATYSGASKGDRGAIDITPHLTPEQRDDHSLLAEIRVQALAHVYPDRLIGQSQWHRNEMFLVETDNGWKIGHASQRIQFNQTAFDALCRQLPAAEAILISLFHRRTSAMEVALMEAKLPLSAIEAALIDLDEIMGPDAARVALAGLGAGQAAHWDR